MSAIKKIKSDPVDGKKTEPLLVVKPPSSQKNRPSTTRFKITPPKDDILYEIQDMAPR